MEIDECAPKDKSICTNNIGSYTCRCKKGFIGDGRNCTSKYNSNYYNDFSKILATYVIVLKF